MTDELKMSETPKTKEDYVILTAWVETGLPSKPSLRRKPVQCISLVAYQAMEHDLLECQRRLREAEEEAQNQRAAARYWRDTAAEAAERRPSLADELRAKGYKEHGQEPNLPIGAVEERGPSAEEVREACWSQVELMNLEIPIPMGNAEYAAAYVDGYEKAIDRALSILRALDFSTVGGKGKA